MKRIFQSLLLVAVIAGSAVSVGSCSDEDEMAKMGEAKKVPLEIVTNVTTRSIITGTTLPEESQFGVFAMSNDNEATLQNGRNARVSYIKGKCSLDNPIYLADESTLIYAYYPYTEIVESARYVNIEASSQTDYLYANTTVEGGSITVNQRNPQATLNFRHALSRITFKIKKSSNNTDDYNLQLVGLSNMYKNAFLDLKVGGIFEYGGNVTLESKIAGDVNKGEVTVDFLVIPINNVRDREVCLNLDLEKHTDVSVLMPSAVWESGKQYTYTVTIERNKLSISEAVIAPWNNNMQENINVNEDNCAGASIGDIYYSDGTYSSKLLSDKMPIGIVFALTDEKGGEINRELRQSQHGRIVALQDIEPAEWSEEYGNLKIPDWEIHQYWAGNIQIRDDGRIQIWDIPGVLCDFDGLKNSQYLSTSAYPAGYSCYMYQGEPGTWYLPSCGELQLVYELYTLKIVYSRIQTCFRDLMIGKPYWTSNEYDAEAAVVWTNTEIWQQDKRITNYLRPASTF